MIPLADTVRIFPLGEVVLFPDTLLPLHIFEQRYRKMVADSLDADRTIGMVLIRRGDPAGNPDIYPVGCAGRIVEHESLPDGRSLIVLQGTVKFRVKSELVSDEPYRLVEAQALYEAPAPAEHMRAWRDQLRARMADYVEALEGDVDALDKLFGKLAIEKLVNCLSSSLPLDVIEKQSLLECATAEQRFERLCELVEYKAAEARLGLDSARDADA